MQGFNQTKYLYAISHFVSRRDANSSCQTIKGRKCCPLNLKLSLSHQIAVWNAYRGMNLTETHRDKNTNVTDSMANRTLIVTTILVRMKVKWMTAMGEGGEYLWAAESTDRRATEENVWREDRDTVAGSCAQQRNI